MVDMAHYAGLVAAGVYPSPVGIADFVTSTTHKTLRGPRGGIILTQAEHEKAINSAVFPGLQGGPLMHVIAAKAVAFGEALGKDFRRYQEQVVENARVLARVLQDRGLRIVSGGTDSHMFLVDLRVQEDHRQGGRSGAVAGAHHRQQERDPQRSGKAVRHLGHPHRQPGDHDARLHRARMRGTRPPDRRCARRARRQGRARARQSERRRTHGQVPRLRVTGTRGQASGIRTIGPVPPPCPRQAH